MHRQRTSKHLTRNTPDPASAIYRAVTGAAEDPATTLTPAGELAEAVVRAWSHGLSADEIRATVDEALYVLLPGEGGAE